MFAGDGTNKRYSSGTDNFHLGIKNVTSGADPMAIKEDG
jgi:hypothetical protein